MNTLESYDQRVRRIQTELHTLAAMCEACERENLRLKARLKNIRNTAEDLVYAANDAAWKINTETLAPEIEKLYTYLVALASNLDMLY